LSLKPSKLPIRYMNQASSARTPPRLPIELFYTPNFVILGCSNGIFLVPIIFDEFDNSQRPAVKNNGIWLYTKKYETIMLVFSTLLKKVVYINLPYNPIILYLK